MGVRGSSSARAQIPHTVVATIAHDRRGLTPPDIEQSEGARTPMTRKLALALPVARRRARPRRDGRVRGRDAGSAADPGVTLDDDRASGRTSPLSGPCLVVCLRRARRRRPTSSTSTRAAACQRPQDRLQVSSTTRYDPAQTVQATRQLVEQDNVFAVFNSLGTEQQPRRSRLPERRRRCRSSSPRRARRRCGRDCAEVPVDDRLPAAVGARDAVFGEYAARRQGAAKVAVLFQEQRLRQGSAERLKRGSSARR